MNGQELPAAGAVGLVWQKSRRSDPTGDCVELAELPDGDIAVRNSRYPDGPYLVYTRAEVEAFVGGAKDGDFDHMLVGSAGEPNAIPIGVRSR